MGRDNDIDSSAVLRLIRARLVEQTLPWLAWAGVVPLFSHLMPR